MGKLSLYHTIGSPPARFAVVTVNHLGLDVELIPLNLRAGEHLKPEYLSINAAGTVPMLVDGDLKVFDSSAIAIYLVENYAKDDSLYPKDPVKRVKVNEKLFYVSSTVFPTGTLIIFPVIFGTANEINPYALKRFERIFETIEKFLTESKYLAGETLTLPDLFLWSIMESTSRILPLDPEKQTNTIDWFKRMQTHPSYEFMKTGADAHISYFKLCLEKNKQLKKQ